MKMSPEVNEIFAAFSAFQNEVTDVKRDTVALKHKYATLDQVLHVSRQLLASHGLGVTQLIGNCSGEHVEIETIILHKSGQFFSTKMMFAMGKIPLNSSGRESINMAQFVGLNISYARRYGLLAILGMTQEDNDAEIPQQRIQQKQYAQRPQHSQEIDMKKLSRPQLHNMTLGSGATKEHSQSFDTMEEIISQLSGLIKEHNVPVEKIDKIMEHYNVKSLNELNEMQAKSVVKKLKSTFEIQQGVL